MNICYTNPKEVKEYLQKKLWYYSDVWDDLFAGTDFKDCCGYQEEPYICIIGIIGSVVKILFENNVYIQKVRLINLYNLSIEEDIDGLEVDIYSRSKPLEEKTVVLCRIEYSETKIRKGDKKFFKATLLKTFKDCHYDEIKKIWEKKPCARSQKMEKERKEKEKELEKLKKQIDNEKEELRELENQLENEKQKTESEKQTCIRNAEKYRELKELFNTWLVRLEKGKKEITYTDVEDEKIRLISELKIISRIQRAINANKDPWTELIEQNKDIEEASGKLRERISMLVRENHELVGSVKDKEADNKQKEKELEELKEIHDGLSLKSSEEIYAILEKISRMIQSDEHVEQIQDEINEKETEIETEIQSKKEKIDSYRQEREEELECYKQKQEEGLKAHKNEIEKGINKQIELNKSREEELQKEKEYLEQLLDDHKRFIDERKGKYLEFLKEFIVKLEKVERDNKDAVHRCLERMGVSRRPYEKLADHVKEFLWNRQKYYKNMDRVVTRFISSIGSGQIILLAGAPGSGKSSFPRVIGEAINARIYEIPVQPNWTDSQDILGYYNPEDKSFIHTYFLDALIAAQKDDEHYYFVLLDEMNLAHVEYYFSIILSAMERGGGISVISETDLKDMEDKEALELRNLRIGKNVQLIGTVNMDELSKNISPKVIDRSILIELSSEETDDVSNEICPPAEIEPWNCNMFEYSDADLDSEPALQENHKNKLKMIKDIYKAIQEFYDVNRMRISGAPVRLSKRSEDRIDYMLSRGAEVEDIILGKLLPCLAWEMSEKTFEELMNMLLNVPGVEIKENSSVIKKLESMKDYTGNSVILDYWLSSRR